MRAGIDLQESATGLRSSSRPASTTFSSSSLAAGRGSPEAARVGRLEIRGVVIAVREHDGVFAGVGEHVEFLRDVAADRAGIRPHRAELQPVRVKMRA